VLGLDALFAAAHAGLGAAHFKLFNDFFHEGSLGWRCWQGE
jgi:hypothetical protein